MTESKKDDLYIAALRYGKSKLESGVIFEDLRAHLSKLDHSFDSQHLENNVFRVAYMPRTGNIEAQRYLTLDAYFQLLEHDELAQARESSRDAMKAAEKATMGDQSDSHIGCHSVDLCRSSRGVDCHST